MTYPPSSAQEIFDIVARHLLTQRERSFVGYIGPEPRCAYRGPKGLKCAVGILIPDELYRESFEDLRCTMLPDREPKLAWMEPHMDLLNDLQHLHDRNYAGSWHQRLGVVAQDHGLSPAVLEEFPE